MKQQVLNLKVSGLYTNPNQFSEIPQGALSIAENVVIDKGSVIESRRGFDKYNNSLRGFLVNAFNYIIKRSRKRKNRKIIKVNLTKQQFFEEFLLHYERFGMNCRYTGVPLTTVSNRGGGQINITQTNLSVDRIDNSLPYQVDNIVFCTHEFNNRKSSVGIDDCKKILKVYEERKLELIEDNYETQS